MRRWLAVLFAALVVLALPAAAGEADWRRFAREMRLADVDGFVETVRSVRETGRLPARYIDKNAAAKLGWRPGDDLCRVAKGRSIGGDRFANREGRLPAASGRRWTEADLDFDCGRRNARRLVFSSDRLIYVTVDHYETFREVPR
jgi:ribonuclease T1